MSNSGKSNESSSNNNNDNNENDSDSSDGSAGNDGSYDDDDDEPIAPPSPPPITLTGRKYIFFDPLQLHVIAKTRGMKRKTMPWREFLKDAAFLNLALQLNNANLPPLTEADKDVLIQRLTIWYSKLRKILLSTTEQ